MDWLSLPAEEPPAFENDFPKATTSVSAPGVDFSAASGPDPYLGGEIGGCTVPSGISAAVRGQNWGFFQLQSWKGTLEH